MVDISRIMDYENGEMDLQDTVEMFQELIDSGMAWELQGHYGRTAVQLIAAGHCTLEKTGEE